MPKDKLLKIDGRVVEDLPNGQFRVEVKNPQIDKPVIIRCYLNGRMRMNKISVMVGDKVSLEIPPSTHIENAIGRIVFRGK